MSSHLDDAKEFLLTDKAQHAKNALIATHGQEAYDKLERRFLRNCARLDEHYDALAKRRKLEHRVEQAWWLTWTAIIVINILFINNATLGDVSLIAMCLLLAKSLHDIWLCKTGRYPPPPTNLERYDD